MSNLISRQAAIEAIKAHRALYCDNTPDTFSKLSYAEKSRVDELDTVIATLVNLPSAQPEQQWIPVSERLPEENGQYLITVKYEHESDYDDIYAEHGEWSDGKWDMFCFGHCGKVESIIAWMPLPEPYAESEG